MRFEDKIALVTGASQGIGRTIAIALAREGASVCVNYVGDAASDADEVVRTIEGFGRRAIAVRADVSVVEEASALVNEVVEAFGVLHVLVNNAGITRDGLAVRMDDDAWRRVIDINLSGAFYVSRAALKHMMRARAGSIVNVSSVVGISGNAGQANYAASKAGIIGMTKSLAKEIGPRGVRVNAVAPGFIETQMTRDLPPDMREAVVDRTALRRLGTPEEVASLVCYLASDEASYITGEVVVVSGGLAI